METLCGLSVFDFRMIHQFPHGETGVFTWKTYVGLGFPTLKNGILPVETTLCGISVFEFHMVH